MCGGPGKATTSRDFCLRDNSENMKFRPKSSFFVFLLFLYLCYLIYQIPKDECLKRKNMTSKRLKKTGFSDKKTEITS